MTPKRNLYKISTISLGLLCLVLIITLIIFVSSKDSETILENENIVVNKNSALTMMLETDVDSNEYEVATSNEWPTEGYIFNAEMSACERGGTLSWDSENNRVLMATSKADKCYVYFDRYTTVRITNVTTSNITNNSITLTIEATAGENSIATYYFSYDDGVSYVESNSNTYTFSNLDMGTSYNFKVYVVDTNGINSNVYSLRESTSSAIYLANFIKDTVYTGNDGDNGLYYHDGSGTYTNAAQEAGDNSYRFSGANPNNYVCFASNAASCPNNNLYRIIGVFGDQVKLIKHDYANSNMLRTNGAYKNTYASIGWSTSYYKGTTSTSSIGVYHWNDSTINNTWSQSNLNTVNLNTNYINYLNGINSKWNDMIETHTWKVGGGSNSYLRDSAVKTAYNYEIGNNSSSTTYSAKIGLMYVSDYGYAASPANWTTTLYNYNNNTNRNNNWMFMGLQEWTISRGSDNSYYAFYVRNTGDVFDYYVYDYSTSTSNFIGGGVRPSFYLKSNVTITSGDGSSSNPYRLSYNPSVIEFSIDGKKYSSYNEMTWNEWINSNFNEAKEYKLMCNTNNNKVLFGDYNSVDGYEINDENYTVVGSDKIINGKNYTLGNYNSYQCN